MSLELQVLSGARAGVRERFEKSIVALGRHPLSDLQLDAQRDLDVSTRHAEIRGIEGRYTLIDLGSTNGTFVNGTRVNGEVELHDGDRVRLGAQGPELAVGLLAADEAGRDLRSEGRASSASAGGNSVAGASAAVGAPPRVNDSFSPGANRHPSPPAASEPAHPTPPRRPTVERIAEAVEVQTRSMKRILIGAVVVLGAGVGVAFWVGQRSATRALEQLVARNQELQQQIGAQARSLGDTTLAAAVKAKEDSILLLKQVVQQGTTAEQESARNKLKQLSATQVGIAGLDMPAISRKNDGAVAFLVSEIEGRAFGGTAFSVRSDGLLVTNRHNVRSENGSAATRIAIEFANTSTFLPAHIVKVDDAENEDLALVQIDQPGTYPTVTAVRSSLGTVVPGTPLVSIGFPHSMDLPQDGDRVRTTLQPGVVSKAVDAVLQMDSYAGHGSSGSPVFDASGAVIGVVWGGAAESNGRIVYAVPSDRLAAFLPADARAIVR